jgi:hypothetical protein
VTSTASVPEPGTKIAGTAAALAATGALACGACCVLPFALPAAMLGVSGGVLAWFGSMKPLMTLVALVAVVVAWAWVALQTIRTHRRPARAMLLTMAAATVLLAAALAWPLFERPLLALLR